MAIKQECDSAFCFVGELVTGSPKGPMCGRLDIEEDN